MSNAITVTNHISTNTTSTPLNRAVGMGNGSSADFNNDGYADLIFATDMSTTAPLPSVHTPIVIFTYNPKSKNFTNLNLHINGGDATAQFVRDIDSADINNDGIMDFIPIDQNEYTATDSSYGPFTGAYQYAYISTSIGNYNKVDLGIGLANTHGYAILKSADGKFRIAENTPWTGSNPSNFSISTYNDSTGQFDSQLFNDGDSFFSSAGVLYSQYFFTTGVDVNNDGNTDIIGLTAPNGINTIYLNNGFGEFTFSKTIDTGLPVDVTVENTAVGDFNGDGYQDFAVEGIDRRAIPSGVKESKTVRILINDQHGGFTDQTSQWIGNNFQYADIGFFYFNVMDINADGKTDLLFAHQVGQTNYNWTWKTEALISNGSSFDIQSIGSHGPRLIATSNNQFIFEKTGHYGSSSTISISSTVVGTADNDEIYGYAGKDSLTGLAGNDTLDGGTGNDTMIGGLGDDTYYVDVAKDAVTEKANEGTDAIISTVTYTLANNVENLTLSGSSAINAAGNSTNNIVIGNSAANSINGGLGSDTLTGGTGNDTFIFNSKLGSTNIDTITDFTSGRDKIALDDAIFTKLKGDKDLSDNLYIQSIPGTSTQDTNDYLFYDFESGRLYYDADGSGTKSIAVVIAIIGSATEIAATDFVII